MIDGKFGTRHNLMTREQETPENRATEVATYLTTVAHVSSFQHAKSAHLNIETGTNIDFATNFNKLLKGTFKQSFQKKSDTRTLAARATDQRDNMTWYGLVARGSHDLSAQYQDLFTKIMDPVDSYNCGNFVPAPEAEPSNDYHGIWGLDSFDKMMTSIEGKNSLQLNVRCPSLSKELSRLAQPYAGEHKFAVVPLAATMPPQLENLGQRNNADTGDDDSPMATAMDALNSYNSREEHHFDASTSRGV